MAMPIPVNLTMEQRAQLCVELLNDLGTQESLPLKTYVAVRSAILKFMQNSGGANLETSVWNEGYYDDPGSIETVTARTPKEMGKELAADKRVTSLDVDSIQWVVSCDLSDEEQTEIKAAYDLEIARHKAIEAATAEMKKAHTRFTQARRTLDGLRADLQTLRPDLNEAAIALRESHICEAEALVASLKDQHERAAAALKAL